MKKAALTLVSVASLLAACSSTTSVGELNYAIINDDVKAVRLGIENGANVNGTNNEVKATPMHTAAGKGNITIVRELVTAGGEIDTPDCGGRTPLMYAVKANSVAVSRYLIEKGARVNHTAKNSQRTCEKGHPEDTPLVIASAVNNPEMVRFLLSKGAKAGGKRAFAFSLLDDSRQPVSKILKSAGYRADEDTARQVAELSSQVGKNGNQQQQTASNSNNNGYGIGDAAADVAITSVLWSVIGF